MMEDYDLELKKVAEKIRTAKAKNVLIQLPDGLKPRAKEIKAGLDKLLGGKVAIFFWLGSCFGACDIPVEAERLGIDLVVQFGHSAWQ